VLIYPICSVFYPIWYLSGGGAGTQNNATPVYDVTNDSVLSLLLTCMKS
jgi:hypothetical protein